MSRNGQFGQGRRRNPAEQDPYARKILTRHRTYAAQPYAPQWPQQPRLSRPELHQRRPAGRLPLSGRAGALRLNGQMPGLDRYAPQQNGGAAAVGGSSRTRAATISAATCRTGRRASMARRLSAAEPMQPSAVRAASAAGLCRARGRVRRRFGGRRRRAAQRPPLDGDRGRAGRCHRSRRRSGLHLQDLLHQRLGSRCRSSRTSSRRTRSSRSAPRARTRRSTRSCSRASARTAATASCVRQRARSAEPTT